MQALVSLINPIRSFREKRRLIHMLLTATHTHTTVLQDGSVFFPVETSDKRWKLFSGGRIVCVTSVVVNTALNKPAV